jgi:hypothetical protein
MELSELRYSALGTWAREPKTALVIAYSVLFLECFAYFLGLYSSEIFLLVFKPQFAKRKYRF